MHALATAAQVDSEAAELLEDTRRQRHTGQERIVTALSSLDSLDPGLDFAEAVDLTYAALSPDVHRILTVERGWTADQYEHWLRRSPGLLLRPGLHSSSRGLLRGEQHAVRKSPRHETGESDTAPFRAPLRWRVWRARTRKKTAVFALVQLIAALGGLASLSAVAGFR